MEWIRLLGPESRLSTDSYPILILLFFCEEGLAVRPSQDGDRNE
jgi:hypothetical protein